MRRFKSIQGKLIMYFVILSFVISLISGLVQYQASNKNLLEENRQSVLKLAVAASLMIDGDDHEQLLTREDESTEIYKEMIQQVQRLQKETGLTYIYTLVDSGDGTTQFIIDSDDNPAHIGYEYILEATMKNAFEGTATANEEVVTDEWLTALTAYAPIKNNTGKIVAIVAVDMEVKKLAEESAKATTEIAQLLSRINSDANITIEEISHANTIAQEQQVAVATTNTTFADMAGEIESMINSIGILAKSLNIIGENTHSIADKTQRVSLVSQENASVAQEASASSEEQNAAMEAIGSTTENLNYLGQSLQGVIAQFKI